jgi:uncharacterized protein (DUF4415 family)
MTNYTRDEIKDKLRGGIHQVVFTKKDGTERKMFCTLSEAVIPEEHRPKKGTTIKLNDNVLAVFDVEKQGWRSFTIADVKHVQ